MDKTIQFLLSDVMERLSAIQEVSKAQQSAIKLLKEEVATLAEENLRLRSAIVRRYQ